MSVPVPMTLLQVQYIPQGDSVYKVLVPKDLCEGQNEGESIVPTNEQPVNPIICQVQDLNDFREQCSAGIKEDPHLTTFVDLSCQFQTVKSLVRLNVTSDGSGNNIVIPAPTNSSTVIPPLNLQDTAEELSSNPLPENTVDEQATTENYAQTSNLSSEALPINSTSWECHKRVDKLLKDTSPISGIDTNRIKNSCTVSGGIILERQTTQVNKTLNANSNSEETKFKEPFKVINVEKILPISSQNLLLNRKFQNEMVQKLPIREGSFDMLTKSRPVISYLKTPSQSVQSSNKYLKSQSSPCEDSLPTKIIKAPVVIRGLPSSNKLASVQGNGNNMPSFIKKTVEKCSKNMVPVLPVITKSKLSRVCNITPSSVANKGPFSTNRVSVFILKSEPSSVANKATSVKKDFPQLQANSKLVCINGTSQGINRICQCKTCGCAVVKSTEGQANPSLKQSFNFVKRTPLPWPKLDNVSLSKSSVICPEITIKTPTIVKLSTKAVDSSESVKTEENNCKPSDGNCESSTGEIAASCTTNIETELKANVLKFLPESWQKLILDSEVNNEKKELVQENSESVIEDVPKDINNKAPLVLKLSKDSTILKSEEEDNDRISITIPSQVQLHKIFPPHAENGFIKHPDVTLPDQTNKLKNSPDKYGNSEIPTMIRSIPLLRKVVKRTLIKPVVKPPVNVSKTVPEPVVNNLDDIIRNVASNSNDTLQNAAFNSNDILQNAADNSDVPEKQTPSVELSKSKGAPLLEDCSTDSQPFWHAKKVRKYKNDNISRKKKKRKSQKKNISAKIRIKPMIKIKISNNNLKIINREHASLPSDSSSDDSESSNALESEYLQRRVRSQPPSKIRLREEPDRSVLSESSDSDLDTSKCKAIELEMEFNRKKAQKNNNQGSRFHDRSLIADHSYLTSELRSIKNAIAYYKNKIKKQSKNKRRLRKLMKVIKPCEVKVIKLDLLNLHYTEKKKKSTQQTICNTAERLQEPDPNDATSNDLNAYGLNSKSDCAFFDGHTYSDKATSTSCLNTKERQKKLSGKFPGTIPKQRVASFSEKQLPTDLSNFESKLNVKKRKKRKRIYSSLPKKLKMEKLQSAFKAKENVPYYLEQNIKVEPESEGSVDQNCSFDTDLCDKEGDYHTHSEQSECNVVKSECHGTSDGEENQNTAYEPYQSNSHESFKEIKTEPITEEFMFEVESDEESGFSGVNVENCTEVKSEDSCDTNANDHGDISSSEKYASLMKLIEQKSELLKSFREKRLSRT